MLTQRQIAIANMIAASLPDKEIAARLRVTPFTVRSQVKTIYRILELPAEVNRRVALAGMINLAHDCTDCRKENKQTAAIYYCGGCEYYFCQPHAAAHNTWSVPPSPQAKSLQNPWSGHVCPRINGREQICLHEKR